MMESSAAVSASAGSRTCPQTRGGMPLVGLMILIAFCVRAAYATAPHVCFGDEACYLWLAKNLFSGVGYTYYNGQPDFHFPPLFPVVLGALNWLVGDWETVSRVAYVIFGSLLPLPVYLLGRDMYSPRIGVVAGFMAAAFPAYTTGILFAETLSEPLYLLCLFTGIYFAYRASRCERIAPAAGAGGLLGLAQLTRSESQVYLFIALVFLAGAVYFRGRPRWSRGAAQLAVVVGTFLLAVFPYAIYLHHHLGSWRIDAKSTTSYTTTRGLVTHNGTVFQRDTWGLNSAGEVLYFADTSDRSLPELLVTEYRGRVLSDVKANAKNLWNSFQKPSVCGRWMLLLAVGGFAANRVLRRRPSGDVLNALVMASLAPVLIFFVVDRLTYGALLAVILWGACGIDLLLHLIETLGARAGGRLAGTRVALQGIVIALVLSYFARSGYRYFQKSLPDQDEVWACAEWLEKNTPPDAVVMTVNFEVSFHAGRGWLPVPVADTGSVLDYGRKRGATHLCLRGRYLDRRPDQRRELYEQAATTADLELLVKSGENKGEPVFVVYRLKPRSS